MANFHLKPSDRVVFYGDSITEQQLYTVYIEAFVRTRFPNLDVLFFNRGWGGDSAGGQTEGGPVELRASRDVAPLEPTVVTVMMGMNDGGYVPYDAATHKRFREEYRRMLANLRKAAPNARFTLIRTSPWDQYTTQPGGAYPGAPFPPVGYNDALLRYGEVVQELADEHGFGYVDFNLPMVDVMKRGKEKDLALATQIVPDWIHPAPAGHLVMALELLKAWNAPSVVSSVTLDAAGGKVLEQESATVQDFDGVSWSQLDKALPFAFPTEEPSIGFAHDLCRFEGVVNQQILIIAGLASGAYNLSVDNEPVGLFASDELEVGVNLSCLDTPMRRQALEVLKLAAKRSLLEMTRWRQVEFKYQSDSAAKAAAALRAVEEEVLAEEIAQAQPVRHTFRLVLV